MKKITKILIILILMIIVIAGIFFLNNSITGNAITGNIIKINNNNVNNTYMYTKALCNESNYCQDNEITCRGNVTISIMPITGAAIQQSENWQDPRNETDKNRLC